MEKEEKALQEPETVELEAEDAAAAVPFEISPGDECEFIPLYSEEEDRYCVSIILCPMFCA